MLLLGARTASAEPLWEAELRLGYGVSVGGGGGMTTTRSTPLTIQAIGSVAISEDPSLSAYGGLSVETLDRSSLGAVGGVRLSPRDSVLRLAGGGVYMFAPYSLWGATVSGGACRVRKGRGLCGDLQLTEYFSGTDLAKGHAVTQIQAVVGMVFDAL